MKATARHYKKNKKSYAKKKAYDTEYNKTTKATKKSKLNKHNRRRGTYGNNDGLDACEKKFKSKTKIIFCKKSQNRGDKDDMPGDKRARG